MTDPYEIMPLEKPPNCVVQVPGSKSITNRALIFSALAQSDEHDVGAITESILENALQSDDTEVMIDSLQQLGIAVETHWEHGRIVMPCTPISCWHQDSKKPSWFRPGPAPDEVSILFYSIKKISSFFAAGEEAPSPLEFFCGNSGTTLRFLAAMLTLGRGHYRLDGVARMRERPIGDLLTTLQQMNVEIISETDNGCPPVLIKANGLPGGLITVRGDTSSQYLSALLMVAPYAQKPLSIQIQGELVSIPYVLMTLRMMQQWGINLSLDAPVSELQQAAWWTNRLLHIPQGRYVARQYVIEPDASSASYFWAAAAIMKGKVSVPGLTDSMQGDVAFRDCLARMGCTLPDGETVQGGPLTGIDVDMNAISDTVMTLAVVALFAEGPTRIRHVAHIRHKETDRIAALATELRKVGAVVDEHADGLTIHPRPLHEAVLETYDDHRIAMSLALIGLRIPGIQIKNPACTAKTFPTYWQTLENLRQ